MAYPEHEKLKLIKSRSKEVVDFWHWLDVKGYILCQHVGKEQEIAPAIKPFQILLHEYFEIDINKLGEEKDAMVAEMRDAQAKCKRTACSNFHDNCVHTQTNDKYCEECAIRINRANPEVPNLITIPRAVGSQLPDVGTEVFIPAKVQGAVGAGKWVEVLNDKGSWTPVSDTLPIRTVRPPAKSTTYVDDLNKYGLHAAMVRQVERTRLTVDDIEKGNSNEG